MILALLALLAAQASALHLPVARPTVSFSQRCAAPVLGEGDELGGAIGSTFGEIFGVPQMKKTRYFFDVLGDFSVFLFVMFYLRLSYI